jgi:hypothetical protein
MYQDVFYSNANGSDETEIPLNNFRGIGTVLIQATYDSGTTGTATVQTRLSTNHSWVTVTTFTVDNVQAVIFCPYIKVTLASVAGGGYVRVGVYDL